MAANQAVYYNAQTGMYVDERGNPINVSVNANQTANAADDVYSPDVESAYDYSQGLLEDYVNQVGDAYTPISEYLGQDLTDYLTDVGAYQGYDWTNPSEFYDAPTYTALEGYTRPDLERTDYTDYDLADVESVDPVADALYQAQIAGSNEKIGKAYSDTRQQVLDEIYRTRARPEQAAALLAELGVDQTAAMSSSARDIQFEQANQAVSIAQAEQALKAQQDIAQGQQTLSEEQSQAAERQAYAEYLMGAEQYEQGQGQYEYEQALADAQYKASLEQWYQEQKAAEEQSKYQSEYALAQDLASTAQSQYETDRAAQYDAYNAQLQGQQAATQQFSQGSTYNTNLSEDEREDARKYAATKSASSSPSSASSAYTAKTTTPTTSTSASTTKKNKLATALAR